MARSHEDSASAAFNTDPRVNQGSSLRRLMEAQTKSNDGLLSYFKTADDADSQQSMETFKTSTQVRLMNNHVSDENVLQGSKNTKPSTNTSLLNLPNL